MNEKLRQHYQGLFQAHGDAAEAVQYSDSASQHRRFQVLSEFAPDLGSVVDVGCGLGHFLDALHARGFAGRYLGLDFVQEFVEFAKHKHRDDASVEFRTFDMQSERYPEGYDTYVVCGVFNNVMPDNQAFLESTLRKAFAAARKGVSFNAMSTYVDFQAEGLFYVDPREVFDFCKRELTRKVVLRHEYLVRDDRPPFEFTMYLYK